ncbi:hypothetical protein FEM48_Zijuj06G0155300 [Ziziphus jujuba var. spinosa]|uniref:Uncharacterized protein n=1 Tax=Ziziphus jujuba var. spinosa TaxID=714518 RepID=A0A978VA43_ZIZJJ|nr:hypothetical protein FEM48_Zijuj06G0155300 [Ziziphus jujuba var. spinosa]
MIDCYVSPRCSTAAIELALLNMPISNKDLTLYIINGLSPELKDMAATFRTRESSISYVDLHEQLIEHDSYLKRIATLMDNMAIIANVVYCSQTGSSSSKNSSQFSSPSQLTFTTNIVAPKEPQTVAKALAYQNWFAAMKKSHDIVQDGTEKEGGRLAKLSDCVPSHLSNLRDPNYSMLEEQSEDLFNKTKMLLRVGIDDGKANGSTGRGEILADLYSIERSNLNQIVSCCTTKLSQEKNPWF